MQYSYYKFIYKKKKVFQTELKIIEIFVDYFWYGPSQETKVNYCVTLKMLY